MKKQNLKYTFLLLSITCLLNACSSNEWTNLKTIELGDITPIGLTYDTQKQTIWVADGDNNRLVEISKDGIPKDTLNDFERPMHLDYSSQKNAIYVPEYGADSIVILTDHQRSNLSIPDSLDAPASVSVYEQQIAIADFYKHRILYFDGQKWQSFGQEGKTKGGDFYYPTDVQITAKKIYVADAYNNRVQVFDKQGTFLQAIGKAEKMNATTGIFVTDQALFATDFENNRVLIYNLKGELQQIIEEKLDKPTDVLQINNTLYIANYKGKNFQVYKK